MDTKLKKWKSVVSLAVLAAGIILLLAGIGKLNNVVRYYGLNKENWSDLRQEDFQETNKFSRYLTRCLEAYLSMASEGPVNMYRIGNLNHNYWDYDYNYYYDYDYDYDYDYNYNYETGVVSDSSWDYENNINSGSGFTDEELEELEELGEYAGEYSGGLNGLSEAEKEKYKEQIKKANKESAEHLHNQMKDDKNLLYKITADGKEMYTNTEGQKLDGAAGVLPEGYNFLLYFDGAKVKIIKDGKDIDVYGNGFYYDTNRWYVPGYENFKAGEEYKNITVTIAVSKELKPYSRAGYGRSGYEDVTSELYWQKNNINVQKEELRKGAVLLAISAAFLLAGFFLRKWKREGDRLLGVMTGRIWFEVKVLAAFIPVIWFALPWIGNIISRILLMINYDYYEEWGESWEYYNSGYFSDKEGLILALLSILLMYLFINDMIRNKKTWRHGICNKIYQLVSAKETSLPAAQRLIHRGIWLVGGTLLLGIVMITAAIFAVNEYQTAGIMILIVLLVLVGLTAIQVIFLKKSKETAMDLDLLTGRITQIHNGGYESTGEKPADEGLARVAAELEDIRRGMEKAIDETVKSERMKVELVTNVSHDIKTPLTSIISYVEFLKQEEDLPEHVKDYIRILDEKSKRLNNMIQDVFAVSKAASGQLPVKLEVLDFGKLLNQTLADMEEVISNSKVMIKADIPEHPIMITADGQRLYRVFQNLIQNALKYSLEGSRVFLTLQRDGAMAEASIKNISRMEIKGNVDFTERFARGDESRSDGGSGLGLSIARSFTEACGGSFRLETNADLFVVVISFCVEEEGKLLISV